MLYTHFSFKNNVHSLIYTSEHIDMQQVLLFLDASLSFSTQSKPTAIIMTGSQIKI